MIFACLHPVQTNRIGVEDINEGQSANSLKIQFCVGEGAFSCVRCQTGYFIIKPKDFDMKILYVIVALPSGQCMTR